MLSNVLPHAPPGAAGVMQLLAAAESLTDRAAAALYDLAPIDGLRADHFLDAIHQSNLVEARNSEWSFAPAMRDAFRNLGVVDASTFRSAHAMLLSLGSQGDPAEAGTLIPGYLFTDAGKAYHSAYAGHVDAAHHLYHQVAASSINGLAGIQWLASNFIAEQQAANVLPEDATDLLFLRAMVLRGEGRHEQADALFWQIVRLDDVSRFTAIACDILGVSLRQRDRAKSEVLHRRAIEIATLIADQRGEGVYLHNLALALPREKQDEMEQLFRRSIEIAEEQDDAYSASIRKNGLADLIAHRGSAFRVEAEALLREAIDHFEMIGDEIRVGSPVTTLARVVALDHARRTEAEQLYRRAIEIARRHRDRRGLSLRLFGLGELLSTDAARQVEALALLKESLTFVRPDNVRTIKRTRRLIDRIVGGG